MDRQIYGGISLGIAAMAAISMLALSNVSEEWSLRDSEFGGLLTRPFFLAAIVHLDSSLEILMAFHHCDICNSSNHYDCATATRVSSLPILMWSCSRDMRKA
jgi:hypothetical protein